MRAERRGGSRVSLSRSLTVLAAVAALAACERELILEGERLDPRALSPAGPVETPPNRIQPIALPAQVNHAAWTHRGGSPTHVITHPALSPQPALMWSAPIGAGEDRRFRITADPVVAEGRIFTLDSQATVTATSADGRTLWRTDITAPWAGRGAGQSGGGLAHADGRLFVTSAYGQLVALDSASGTELWRHRFDAPVTGAPAVRGGQVFVVSTDSAAWALNVADGKVLWQRDGTPAPASMVGGAAPAVTDRLVLLPFPSGEVVAKQRDTGAETWRSRVAGRRIGMANAGVTGISGDPVVVGNTIFVGNRSGRVAALDAGTGALRWSARDGAFGPVWPVGDSLFLISDQGELVRLAAASGERIWAVTLERYLEERERRRAEVVAHYGPVLAGGRLIVASNDGQLRGYDPASGELVFSGSVPGGATSHPVVVGGVLYVVSRDGRLHAFR